MEEKKYKFKGDDESLASRRRKRIYSLRKENDAIFKLIDILSTDPKTHNAKLKLNLEEQNIDLEHLLSKKSDYEMAIFYASRFNENRDKTISLRKELFEKDEEIERLIREQDIIIPEEVLSGGTEEGTEAASLLVLVKEINSCYKNEDYTAVALLARKFIVNISYLFEKEHNIKIIDPNLNLQVERDVKGKTKGIYIKKENDKNFMNLISWLYFHRFLTTKDRELLDRMRDVSNEINHKHVVSGNKADARKYFLTIKGLVESNFETKEINFDKASNQKNPFASSIDMTEELDF